MHTCIIHSRMSELRREIEWSPASIEASNRCRTRIINATLLSHPDCQLPTRVVTDASDHGMGASLNQFSEGSWRPLAFFHVVLTLHKKSIVLMIGS